MMQLTNNHLDIFLDLSQYLDNSNLLDNLYMMCFQHKNIDLQNKQLDTMMLMSKSSLLDIGNIGYIFIQFLRGNVNFDLNILTIF